MHIVIQRLHGERRAAESEWAQRVCSLWHSARGTGYLEERTSV